MEDKEKRRIKLLHELHDRTLEGEKHLQQQRGATQQTPTGPATTKQGTPPAVITENIT